MHVLGKPLWFDLRDSVLDKYKCIIPLLIILSMMTNLISLILIIIKNWRVLYASMHPSLKILDPPLIYSDAELTAEKDS